MGKLHRLRPVAVVLLCSFLLSSCISTGRNLFRGRHHVKVNGTSPALKVATRDELNAIIAHTYDAIDSFSAASVELTASQGSVYENGPVKVYTSAPGIILFRKPDSIRIRANVPYLGGLAFDMVSNGTDFRFLLQRDHLFVQGTNSAPATSANKMENLRPEAFLSSMLIRPADPATEYVLLKDDTDEDDALYRLEFIGKTKDGALLPGRDIWFDRQDLSIVRQKVYDENGLTLSDTTYSEWRKFNGVSFPQHIDITRPKEGYGVAIKVLKIDLNKELSNTQFVLDRPEGTTLKVIGK